MDPNLSTNIPGSEEVTRWFGAWPSFHDAEIISLSLARSGESILRVYPCYPDKPAVVEFIFEGVTDLELADFSCQNVIVSLAIKDVVDQNKENAIRVIMSPCYGLAGYIDAKRLRVTLRPGTRPDAVSQW